MPDENPPKPSDPAEPAGSRSGPAPSGAAGPSGSEGATPPPLGARTAMTPEVEVDVAVDPAVVSREKVIGRGITWLATWSARWILIAIALVILGEVVGQAWGILMPVALALLVTAVLAPVSRAMERYLRFPPALAAATTLLGGVALLAWAVFLMAPSVADQSTEIADDAVQGIDRVQKWVRDSDLFNKQQIDEFLAAAQDRLSSSASTIASGVLTGVGAVTSLLINLVVVIFLVFFFLKDGRRFLPWLRRGAGPYVGSHLVEVLSRAWQTLGGFIRTQALVSGIDAVLIGIGLVVIGVPLAVPLAVLTFFGGFIPIVGAIAAGVVAVLVALVSNGFMGAVWVLLLILAVQQVEGNLLSPMLQSKSMDLHPAVVLLSVTLGSGLYGIAGAFLAVPVAAVTAVIFRYLNEQVYRTVADAQRVSAEGQGHVEVMVDTDRGPTVVERANAAVTAVREWRARRKS